MKLQKKNIQDILFIYICILTVYFVIHSFTGMWWISANPYNSYVLQAQRWLSGHLDLGQNYSHLEIAEYGGKYFVSFPPFPSYVMLPFVLIFGQNTPEGFIALAVTLIGAAYLYGIFRHFEFDGQRAVFYTLFVYIGSNMLFIGANAWVWFIAQNMCFTLCTMSLYYALKGRGGTALSFWACAVGCRPINAIYIVLIGYILISERRKNEKPILCLTTFLWLIAPCIIAFSYMVLNYARFGSIFEFGHNYLPEFLQSEQGQFSLSYIKDNMPRLFTFPKISGGKWQYPKFNGMAFYFVTPLFLVHIIKLFRCVACGIKKDRLIMWAVPVLIAVHFLILTMHRTMGGYQFGNRYTLDALPFAAFAAAVLSDNEERYERWYAVLMLLGLCINIAGTIAVYNQWI